MQIVDHIGVRMPGWFSLQVRMIGRQFGMLMRNHIRMLGWSKSKCRRSRPSRMWGACENLLSLLARHHCRVFDPEHRGGGQGCIDAEAGGNSREQTGCA